MMDKYNINDFLDKADGIPVLDVRSPSEYLKGHIPGAISLPLFSDDERKIVGTLYKNQGREEAIQKGFEILAGKYSELLHTGIEIAKSSELLFYCWRGGMRSSSLGWLFGQHNIQVGILEGGYKSYRRLIRSTLKNKFDLRLVGGKTGSGKTEILKELEKKGEQIIDLEKLANHKGSAFGSLGEEEQPSNEQFENLILFALHKLDFSKRIWIEDESRSIGRVFIPPELYLQMRESPVYYIEMNMIKRTERLVNDYGRFPKEDLIKAFEKISRKVGGQHLQEAIDSIKNNNLSKAVEIALSYYDKTYNYGFDKRRSELKHYIRIQEISSAQNAALILKEVNSKKSLDDKKNSFLLNYR